MSLISAASLALLLSLVLVTKAKATEAPIVVELFTSQGCHSCPPADRYLGRLAEDERIIALACHVTYWNYLGWKDTYSLPFCDKRQRSYRDSLGAHSAYTPQMVINGRYEGVGSRQRSIEPLLARAKADNDIKVIAVSVHQGQVSIDATDAINFVRGGDVVLLGLGGKAVVDIKRGENWGRKLKYHRPVLVAHDLENAFDTRSKVVRQVAQQKEIKMWVVLVQDARTGFIRAAGKYETVEG